VERAIACKRAHKDSIMKLPGVTGVGVTQDEHGNPAILVLLKEDSPEIRAGIPKQIEDHPVVVQYTGRIKAH
jgi:hypothetical protein